MTYLGTKDFHTEVAAGNVAGYAIMKAIGEREGMGTEVTGEDVWRGNDLSPTPTSHTTIPTPGAAGEQMTLVSENDADNGATTTGVLTVKLEYLDATGNEQTETVTLDGTTPVNTVATNIRFINDMYAASVGSNGVAEGHIKIYKTGTVGDVYSMIALGGNKSLVPHRMVPLGKTLILKGWSAAEAQNKRVAFRLRSTDMSGVLLSGVFCFKGVSYLNQTTSSHIDLNVAVPALSIVKVSAWPNAISAEGSCYWWGILMDD
jgi:hypothetical protein